MYGVLYAISPEIFPAKDRGTGNGLTATATRVFGVMVRKIRTREVFDNVLRAGTGPDHCSEGESRYCSAGLHRWWSHYRLRASCSADPLRAARQSFHLRRWPRPRDWEIDIPVMAEVRVQ